MDVLFNLFASIEIVSMTILTIFLCLIVVKVGRAIENRIDRNRMRRREELREKLKVTRIVASESLNDR